MSEPQPPTKTSPARARPSGLQPPAPALRAESSKSTNSTGASSALPPASSTTPNTPFSPTASLNPNSPFRVPPSPREGSSGMTGPEPSSKAAKVAIPRLKRSLDSADGTNKLGGRHRVTHACEPCRHRKTKCSGERPLCRHCQDFKIACYYADGKRDRVKKQFGSMQDKVSDYEKILRDLQGRVSDADADLIRTTLDQAAQFDVDETATDTATVQSPEAEADGDVSGAESDVSGGRGSTGDLDITEEDFTREGAKTTGFMGKNSDITWMQRLRQENKYGEGTKANESNSKRMHQGSTTLRRDQGPRPSSKSNVALPEADEGFTVQDSSYHLNDMAISTYEAVDPYEMPPQEHAQMLFMTYMTRVHPSFPFVGRINLQNQFTRFLARPGSQPPPKWLAIINMIFAIAAKYSHLIQAEWQADERDHLIYFTRARMLAIDADTMFNHPDLQMIQILSLMSLYLMTVDQVNRSWNVAGLAIRAATGLGLNMRNDSADLSNSLKEIRYRVWWGLYALEHRLCAMTGRVNCIPNDHYSTPLPVPITEEEFDTPLGTKLLSKEHQRFNRAPSSDKHNTSVAGSTHSSLSPSTHTGSPSSKAHSNPQSHPQSDADWTKDVPVANNGLYFLHLVQLFRLTQTVFHKFYNPRSIEGNWSDVQESISRMDAGLEDWYRKLPAAFDFRRKQRDRDFYEYRLCLGFYYFAAKIMLYRPCLCRLDRKIPGQSDKSKEFNHAAATTCVMAAQEQLSLIPDEPNAIGLLRTGPWVSILHCLVQAATVLMLEISFRAHHMPQQSDSLIESAKKAVRWLHALGDENLAAARAWRLCTHLLQGAAQKMGRNIDDLPRQPPRSVSMLGDSTRMSGNTAIQRQQVGQASGQRQNQQYGAGFPSLTMPYTTMGMPDMTAYAAEGNLADPFGRYDQYYAGGDYKANHMAYKQQDHMQFDAMDGMDGMPTDAEMNFMNQYTEQQEDHASRGTQGGRWGFG